MRFVPRRILLLLRIPQIRPAISEPLERAMIEKALRDARFNKSETAKALGLTRAQLYVRLRRHGLDKHTL